MSEELELAKAIAVLERACGWSGLYNGCWLPAPAGEVILKTLKHREAFTSLMQDIHAWSMETFPEATPAAKAAHLLKEAKELHADPFDDAELADVFILALGIAALRGVDPIAITRAKLEVNKRRTWGPPGPDGVIEHVREDGE